MGVAGFGLVGLGELANDVHGLVAQLGVAGVEVDHQVVDDFATFGHCQCGDHVQDHLCGGITFEAGGVGQ